jgi:hypothetical protein
VSDDERRGEPHEPVGSVGEEAAKLLAALQDWARESGSDYAGAGAAAAAGAASVLKDVNEHIATGGADCRYCPICRAIAAVRATSPEVKAHLASAASSLMLAAAGAMATHVADQARSRRDEPPVEKIDLSDDGDWEDD